MASIISNRRIARFASAVALTFGASLGVRDAAEACGGWGPSIVELTTFDPGVLGEPAAEGLLYDPFSPGYGGCVDCAETAMLADWKGYLAGAVTDADWAQVLLRATPGELMAISQRLAGTLASAPKGYDKSSLWSAPAAQKAKLVAAVAFVKLARDVEPYASFEGNIPASKRPALVAELATAQAGMKSAPDAFLRQRYAFQVLRVVFYRREWAKATAFFDKQLALLAGPSADLAWRARYYLAGALRKDGKLARANLELARIHGGYAALAGAAAEDFHPQEDGDWKAALKLAKDNGERAQLWRLVGIKTDGLVAAQEIAKLDPRSRMIGLLLVRELARAESMTDDAYGPPDPKDVAAQNKAYTALEQLCMKLAATPGVDRGWLLDLIAGHIAARRGDLANARTRLTRAAAARPGDVRVASQAKASLAMALVLDWKIDPRREDELARQMNAIDAAYARLATVRGDVRAQLAKAYKLANKLVDAEYLHPGTADDGNKGKLKWHDPAFIKQMIARGDQRTTEFDKFVVSGGYTRPQLDQELALRYLADGDFQTAAKLFQTTKATSELLHTDPFVIHIVDCHDCDHERYANAKWTHASLAQRLVELEQVAKGTGEPAAEAALAIGNAMYNITWWGNARAALESSHQSTDDPRVAERWYKRAFDLSSNRELKAKAAFLASKAELGRMISDAIAASSSGYYDGSSLPIPTTWFPIVKRYKDTKYVKEVLRECGHYAAWAKTSR